MFLIFVCQKFNLPIDCITCTRAYEIIHAYIIVYSRRDIFLLIQSFDASNCESKTKLRSHFKILIYIESLTIMDSNDDRQREKDYSLRRFHRVGHQFRDEAVTSDDSFFSSKTAVRSKDGGGRIFYTDIKIMHERVIG